MTLLPDNKVLSAQSHSMPCRGLFILLLCFAWIQSQAERPNVILIMTDDQGYGDLSCHGNPILKTPNLDKLYDESIRLSNFHVSPFCTPTRAALMTGRYPARTGAYRTSSGRTMMHPEEQTIAQIFSDDGYKTGMVGKWHLGDNAPHRPQDRGFQDVVWHRCGGVGQASDYYGNDYFDDTYERNGKFEKFEGYCTDVWFSESIRFIEENKDQSFFLYLAPNAPHGPYYVDPKWSAPYKDKVKWRSGAKFYGMVANIDYNVGLMRDHLKRLGLSENTIFIFMTDNGTANGAQFSGLTSEAVAGYNAGMRGKKSSVYEGGHRVPCFIHWPKGGLLGGKDRKGLSAHLDLLPTLAEFCSVPVPASIKFDGVSLASYLRGETHSSARSDLVVQFQGGPSFKGLPKPWEYTCVLRGQWRLMDGKDLYDISKDPAQRHNVAAQFPDIVNDLKALYMPFWESVENRMVPVSIDIGNPNENPTTLCSQDWYMPTGNPPWNFGQIRRLPKVSGPWNVDVKDAGKYKITLRQWPEEANKPILATLARLKVGDQIWESQIKPQSIGVDFYVQLPKGKTTLHTWLVDKDKKEGGAYFTEVLKL